MYKIESILLSWGFKKIKEYDSGVIVYSDKEDGDLYSSEVALFTKRDPKTWEITIWNPYSVTLSPTTLYDRKEFLKTQSALNQDYINATFNIYDNLKSIEDPWSEVDSIPSNVNVGREGD